MVQPEEPLQNVAYLYDGTLEGLLSAIFLSYDRRETPEDIVTDRIYQARLGQSAFTVQTDLGQAERVRKGIILKAGRNAFVAIMRASTCDDYEMGSIVLRFVRYAMSRNMAIGASHSASDNVACAAAHDFPSVASERKARGSARQANAVLDDLSRPEVHDLMRLATHAMNEAEKMRQFIRFSHLENGVWFARCNPNASVVPLVMGHFAARLNDQPFIIYDENHHLAGVYDGKRWQLVAQDAIEPCSQTADDVLMQQAWKRFYDTLSVDARYNPELRRSFMPVRFWSTLPEMKPDTGASIQSL